METTLSIIVPVYNVQNYLCQCIDSILNQPFQDFELLLIDDGSNDDSGKLCEEYANKDIRIKVYHKSNGGLSSARNLGLEKCKGKYISFVDSDDYLIGDYYTKAIDIFNDNTVDVVWLQYAKSYDNGSLEKVFNAVYKICTKQDCLLSQLVTKEAFAWVKIYRKEVFHNLRYPEGQILEDLYIVPDLYEKINKCVVTPLNGYYVYRQRCGSICNIHHTSRMISDIALAYARIILLCKNYNRKQNIKTLATYSSGYLNALVLFSNDDFEHLKVLYNRFDYTYCEVIKSSLCISQKIKLTMLKLLGYQGMLFFYKYVYKMRH